MEKVASKQEIRREEILGAVFNTILEEGIHQLSMERVASRIGVAKATVYKYFESKDEIYARLYLDYYQDFINQISLMTGDFPVIPALRGLVRTYITFHMKDLTRAAVISQCKTMINYRNITKDTAIEMETFRKKRFSIVYGVINRGLQEGLFRDVPIESLTEIGIRLLDGVLACAYEMPVKSRDQQMETLLMVAEDMVVRGLMRL